MSESSDQSKAAPRPSWLGLYARAGLMLAALPLVQRLVARGPELVGVQCALVLGGFVAMGRWARRNRAELDRLDWCDCASSRMTVREIPSRRGRPLGLEDAEIPAPVEAEPVTPPIEEGATVDAAR